ncbi:MAG TPA: hypothetical protein VGK67_33395 [Myxococcales bacterium]
MSAENSTLGVAPSPPPQGRGHRAGDGRRRLGGPGQLISMGGNDKTVVSVVVRK